MNTDLATAVLFGRLQAKVSWTAKLEAPPAPVDPLVQSDRVLLADSQNHLSSIGLDGQKQWRSELAGALEFTPVAGPEGRLAAVGRSHLQMLDGDTGKVLWSHNIPRGATGPPVFIKDRVYVATEGQELIGYNLEGKEEVRERYSKPPVPFTIAPTGDGRLALLRRGGDYAIYNPDRWLFKTSRWQRLAGMPKGAPKIGPDGKAYTVLMQPGMIFKLAQVEADEVKVLKTFPEFTPIRNMVFGPAGALAVMTAQNQLSGLSGKVASTQGADLYQDHAPVAGGPGGYLLSSPAGQATIVRDGKEIAVSLPEAARGLAVLDQERFLVAGERGTLFGIELEPFVDAAKEQEIELEENAISIGDHLIELS